MPDSPFHFADTASARQQTTDLSAKLMDEKVAIVGLGGTGSYVLDFVAKTWVKEIRLFDNDDFLQHNAFRAPGSFSREDLKGTNKAEFHGERYSQMHSRVVAHPKKINEDSVHLLFDCNTVFLCIDGGAMKRTILDSCLPKGTLLIDCGMGVKRAKRESRPLLATIRVTTCTQDNHSHVSDCIDLSTDDDPDDEYERNAQMAELNALNATLAVIKWKKMRGIYTDFASELHTLYVLDGNRLINRYEANHASK